MSGMAEPVLIDAKAAKMLYKDLRDRINVASEETIRGIIENYSPDEGDEGMVFATTYITPQNPGDDPYYETEADAADIMAAFKSGKYCIIYFPDNEDAKGYGCYECAVAVAMVQSPNRVLPDGEIRLSNLNGHYIGEIQTDSAYIETNGKLHIPIYVD